MPHTTPSSRTPGVPLHRLRSPDPTHVRATQPTHEETLFVRRTPGGVLTLLEPLLTGVADPFVVLHAPRSGRATQSITNETGPGASPFCLPPYVEEENVVHVIDHLVQTYTDPVTQRNARAFFSHHYQESRSRFQVTMLAHFAEHGATGEQIEVMRETLWGSHTAELNDRFKKLATLFLTAGPSARLHIEAMQHLLTCATASSQTVFNATLALASLLGSARPHVTLQKMFDLCWPQHDAVCVTKVYQAAMGLEVAAMPVYAQEPIILILGSLSAQDCEHLQLAMRRRHSMLTPEMQSHLILSIARLFPGDALAQAAEDLMSLVIPEKALIHLLAQLSEAEHQRAELLITLASILSGRPARHWQASDHHAIFEALKVELPQLRLLISDPIRPLIDDATTEEIKLLLRIAQTSTSEDFEAALVILKDLYRATNSVSRVQAIRTLYNTPDHLRDDMQCVFFILNHSVASPRDLIFYLDMVCRMSVGCQARVVSHTARCIHYFVSPYGQQHPQMTQLIAAFCQLIQRAARDPHLFMEDQHAFVDFDAAVDAISTLQGILALQEGTDLPGAQPMDLRAPDLENAMVASNHSHIYRALGLLVERSDVQKLPRLSDTVRSILEHVQTIRNQADHPDHPALIRRRGGSLEADNAMRTLVGPRTVWDLSDSIESNNAYSTVHGAHLGMGDVLGLVWQGIATFGSDSGRAVETDHEKALMRHSLVMNLAQCIEDDGHRVCNHGMVQRLVAPLYGRIPGLQADIQSTPASFVKNSAARAFAHIPPTDEPSLEAFAAYRADALQEAASEFGAATAAYHEVVRIIDDYAAVTFLS
jgi:hypothetical protein